MEAAVTPLPSPLTTPPVTKIYLVIWSLFINNRDTEILSPCLWRVLTGCDRLLGISESSVGLA